MSVGGTVLVSVGVIVGVGVNVGVGVGNGSKLPHPVKHVSTVLKVDAGQPNPAHRVTQSGGVAI